MSRGRKLGQLLLAGIAFGVLVDVIKGQDAGVRNALGNTSAPWVLVPFLAGTRYSRVWHAALVGLATTLAAFFGFYLAEAAILDLGPHPWYTDLKLTLGSGRVYEMWGSPAARSTARSAGCGRRDGCWPRRSPSGSLSFASR